jgi:hypothetical protein
MEFPKDKVLAPVAGKLAHHTSSSTAHKAVEAVGTDKVNITAVSPTPASCSTITVIVIARKEPVLIIHCPDREAALVILASA